MFILREVVSARAQSFLFSLLPAPLRIQGRSYFENYWLDLLDQWHGRQDTLVPPRHLNISGGGPFRIFGRNTVDLCHIKAGLQPSDTVIDIGCGIGRTALALTGFLTTGSYLGFDVIRFAIQWCQQHIAAAHPQFRFDHADIFNRTYNPRGRLRPESFRFPYDDGAGSFAVATSLFTHLLPGTIENYVAESARVLRPGSRFLSTWFLLDAEVESARRQHGRSDPFPHRFPNHAQGSLHAPEQAVAFPRDAIVRLFESNRFTIEAIYRGDWTGLADDIHSMQDVIVAQKR